MPYPQRAKPAPKSARCGVGDGSPGRHPPHSQPVGSGPLPHARKDEWSGVGERPTPDGPHRGRRRPARAPSCRPHSAPSQHARARAVGLVTGPHARTPRTHSQWVERLVLPLDASRDRSRRKEKTKKKTHNQRKKSAKSIFRTSEIPKKYFTPPFGEVAKFRTLTEEEEQQNRDGNEVELCLPKVT